MILVVKLSVYLNRHVFVMFSVHQLCIPLCKNSFLIMRVQCPSDSIYLTCNEKHSLVTKTIQRIKSTLCYCQKLLGAFTVLLDNICIRFGTKILTN